MSQWSSCLWDGQGVVVQLGILDRLTESIVHNQLLRNGNNLNLDIVIVSIAINAHLSDFSNDQLIFDMM